MNDFILLDRYVCIETRCPESMWLITSPRPYVTDNDSNELNTTCRLQQHQPSDITKHHSLTVTIIISVIMLSVYSGK